MLWRGVPQSSIRLRLLQRRLDELNVESALWLLRQNVSRRTKLHQRRMRGRLWLGAFLQSTQHHLSFFWGNNLLSVPILFLRRDFRKRFSQPVLSVRLRLLLWAGRQWELVFLLRIPILRI